VEAGEKLPHAALPQVTVHLTPPLLLSLLTTAVRLAVAAVTSDVGAAGLKFTEMTGVTGGVVAGGVFDPPPHPVIQIVVAANAKR
jgi:ABC-type phosphonate transport system ATPase subunit